MKAAIYSPYWDTMGGGEYYAGSVAKLLSELGYNVEIISPFKDTVINLNNRFQLDLQNVTINIPAVSYFNQSIFKKKKLLSQYDLIFFVSDGSVPFLFGRQNILHFQVPFKGKNNRKFLNWLKFKTINHTVCNSHFTKKVIDQEFGIKSIVIHPAVQSIGPSGRKQKLILSVGRFDGNSKGKRQDALIEGFIKLNQPSWRLVLAGGVLDKNAPYVKKLKHLARGYNISILTDIPHQQISNLYRQASIYWHAHGYQTDLLNNPQNSEHFGISVVEAMSAGAIPVVFNGGGLTEIVDTNTGYLWNNLDELLSHTKDAMNKINDRQFINQIIGKSHQFSKKVFDEKFQKILR